MRMAVWKWVLGLFQEVGTGSGGCGSGGGWGEIVGSDGPIEGSDIGEGEFLGRSQGDFQEMGQEVTVFDSVLDMGLKLSGSLIIGIDDHIHSFVGTDRNDFMDGSGDDGGGGAEGTEEGAIFGDELSVNTEKGLASNLLVNGVPR